MSGQAQLGPRWSEAGARRQACREGRAVQRRGRRRRKRRHRHSASMQGRQRPLGARLCHGRVAGAAGRRRAARLPRLSEFRGAAHGPPVPSPALNAALQPRHGRRGSCHAAAGAHCAAVSASSVAACRSSPPTSCPPWKTEASAICNRPPCCRAWPPAGGRARRPIARRERRRGASGDRGAGRRREPSGGGGQSRLLVAKVALTCVCMCVCVCVCVYLWRRVKEERAVLRDGSTGQSLGGVPRRSRSRPGGPRRSALVARARTGSQLIGPRHHATTACRCILVGDLSGGPKVLIYLYWFKYKGGHPILALFRCH